MSDLMETLSHRAHNWRHNADKARVSVPLGEIRTALATISQLQAEIARYRQALRQISRETETDHIGDTWLTRGASIARATLGGSND